MILTEDEIEQWLSKHSGSPEKLADDSLRTIIWYGVERFVKREAARNFESTSYDKYYDVRPYETQIDLDDWPVSAFTSFQKVTGRSPVTLEDMDGGDYVIDMDAGKLKMIDSYLPSGVSAVRLVYTAGYTTAQIAANYHDVPLLKQLLLSIIQREWAINKEPKRHLRTYNFGDESSSYNFDLTRDEERILNMLSRKVWC